jgi:hypothetical protein
MITDRRRRPWLARHPLMHTAWLEASNRLRASRAYARSRRARLVIPVVVASVGVSIPVGIRWLPALLQVADTHLATVSVLLALQASMQVHRGRRKWTEIYRSNWLSTVPVSRREFAAIVVLRAVLTPLVGLVLLTVLVLLAGIGIPRATGVELPLLAGSGIATVVGALLGWYLPHRDTKLSRPVPFYTVGAGARSGATLAGLSGWATAQAKVWLQPRLLARLLLPAMLALPMDVSANVAVALLFVWTVAVYLFVLLRATADAARRGAAWLRPTPLPFYRFAWAVARVPLMKQLQWTLIVSVLLVALGVKPLLAARAAECWLALVSVTSGVTIAQAYRSRTWTMNLLLSVSALAVLERVKEHTALPGALLISAWQLRKAARA